MKIGFLFLLWPSLGNGARIATQPSIATLPYTVRTVKFGEKTEKTEWAVGAYPFPFLEVTSDGKLVWRDGEPSEMKVLARMEMTENTLRLTPSTYKDTSHGYIFYKPKDSFRVTASKWKTGEWKTGECNTGMRFTFSYDGTASRIKIDVSQWSGPYVSVPGRDTLPYEVREVGSFTKKNLSKNAGSAPYTALELSASGDLIRKDNLIKSNDYVLLAMMKLDDTAKEDPELRLVPLLEKSVRWTSYKNLRGEKGIGFIFCRTDVLREAVQEKDKLIFQVVDDTGVEREVSINVKTWSRHIYKWPSSLNDAGERMWFHRLFHIGASVCIPVGKCFDCEERRQPWNASYPPKLPIN